MKSAAELHDEWARGRGIDSPEESQAKRKAYLEALEAEQAEGRKEEAGEPSKAASSPAKAPAKKK